MNHYLEIKDIERADGIYYQLWLQTGTGPEFWIGSHSHSRIASMADHIAVIEAPNGIDKMKIVDSSALAAMVPLVESYAKMRKA